MKTALLKSFIFLFFGLFLAVHGQSPTDESTTDVTSPTSIVSGSDLQTTVNEQTTSSPTLATTEISSTSTTVPTSLSPSTSTIVPTSLGPSTSTTVPQNLSSTTTIPSVSSEFPTSSTPSTDLQSSTVFVSTEIITSSTSPTTQPTGLPFFECDFNTPCFAANQLQITDGSEFNSDDLSEPPRAPTSDAGSISAPTVSQQQCLFPFQPLNATWDMFFCYKNQCPIDSNGTLDTCTTGNYGLIALNASTTFQSIRDTITSSSKTTSRAFEQRCLRYSYYFTVYEGQDWGQKALLAVQVDNVSDWELVIDQLSAADMKENRWYSRSKTFNSSLSNFTFSISFEVSDVNRTENNSTDSTVYFAIDNIQFFHGRCSDDPTPTPPPPTATTTSTQTTTAEATAPTSKPKSNLGLILGLSLGLGVPTLLAIIIGVFYFNAQKKKNSIRISRSEYPMGLTSKRS